MHTQRSIDVTEPSQVGEARRESLKVAQAADMDETTSGKVAIVATELAGNLARYGSKGRLLLQSLGSAAGTCVELIAVDSGPGMADLHRCMDDGYSSGRTPGAGLGAVRRLSDVFDAYSVPGQGTVVVSRIHCDGWTGNGRNGFVVGAISLPAPRELVCGDRWCVLERHGELAVMIADGLGHGPQAAEAAMLAQASFRANPFASADVFLRRAHGDLAGSRGAAVACAHVTASGAVGYGGVGNIAGALVSFERLRGLPTENGTVGVEMRKVAAPARYEWPERGLLIMHSDGLTKRWTLDPYPGLLVRHPAVVASVLWRDFVRGNDDATVVVVAAPPSQSA